MHITNLYRKFALCTKTNTMVQPTSENTLYLPIKQKYFDEILSGKKDKEYREIKDTTALKYLESWSENGQRGLYYIDTLIDQDPLGEICIYNNGVYPFSPIPYKFLHLAVGYAKERDEAVVEVTNITFEPLKTKEGKDARFDVAGDDFIPNPEGFFCIWQVVYHLGKVVETNLKKDK